MKIYIAGLYAEGKCYCMDLLNSTSLNMLESFHYFKSWELEYIKSKPVRSFMLDSGAFTVLTQKKVGNITESIPDYIEQYTDFIMQHEIDLFFELDIDAYIGLKKVEEVRAYINTKTGRQCIPVWHKSRGRDYFIDMCKEYPYVAIGGLVSGEIPASKYEVFPWFIRTAHHHGALIHALGLGSTRALKKYPFDSIDCTSWSPGRIGPKAYHFTGTDLKAHSIVSDRKFKKNELATHNLGEWIKFANYMEYDYVYD